MSYYENLQRRYGYKQLNVARWNDPMGSVHPARGGPRTPVVSADVANKPVQSGYKVTYRRPPPPPTDDEDSADDEEDQAAESTGVAEVAAPVPADETPIESVPTVPAPESSAGSCDITDAEAGGVTTLDTAAADGDRPEPAISEPEKGPATPSPNDSGETPTAIASDDKGSAAEERTGILDDGIAPPAPIEQIVADAPAGSSESPVLSTSDQAKTEVPPPAPEPPRAEEHELETPVSEDAEGAADSAVNAGELPEAGSQSIAHESHPNEESTGDITHTASGAPEVCTEVTHEEPVVPIIENFLTTSVEPTTEPDKSAVEPPSEQPCLESKQLIEAETSDKETSSQSQPVEDVPGLSGPTPDTQHEEDDDKKVSWAPGTTEPKPTVRKKKGSKSSKPKGKKKQFALAEGNPDDIVAIVNVVDGDDVLEHTPTIEVSETTDLMVPIATDESPSGPVPPAEERQDSSIDPKTIPNDAPELSEANIAQPSTAEPIQISPTSPIDDGSTPAKTSTISKSGKVKNTKSSKGKDKDKGKAKKSSSKTKGKSESPRAQPEAIVVKPASAVDHPDTATEEDAIALKLAREESTASASPDAESTAEDVEVSTNEATFPDTTEVVATDDATVSVEDDEAAETQLTSTGETDVLVTMPVSEESPSIPSSESSQATAVPCDTDEAGAQGDEQNEPHQESTQPEAEISSDGPSGSPDLGNDTAPNVGITEIADTSGIASTTKDPEPEQVEVHSDRVQAEDDIAIASEDSPAMAGDDQATTERTITSGEDSSGLAEPAAEPDSAANLDVTEGGGATADVKPDEGMSSACSSQVTEEVTKVMAAGEDMDSAGKTEVAEAEQAADSAQSAAGESNETAPTGVEESVQDDGRLNVADPSEKDNNAMTDEITPGDEPDGGAAERDISSEATARPADLEGLEAAEDVGSETTNADKTPGELSETAETESRSTGSVGPTDSADLTVVVTFEREAELGAKSPDADGEDRPAIDATTEEHSAAQVEEAALNEVLPQASHEQAAVVPDELLVITELQSVASETPSKQDEVTSDVPDNSNTSSDPHQPPATEDVDAAVTAEKASKSTGSAQEETATTEEPKLTAEKTDAGELDSESQADHTQSNTNSASCDPASTKSQDEVVADEIAGELDGTPAPNESQDVTKETDSTEKPEIKVGDTLAEVNEAAVVTETANEIASHEIQAGEDIGTDAPEQDGGMSFKPPSPSTDAPPNSAAEETSDTVSPDDAPTADMNVIEQPTEEESASGMKTTNGEYKAETSAEHPVDGENAGSTATESSLANTSSETEITALTSATTSDSTEPVTSTEAETVPVPENVEVKADPPAETELLKANLPSQGDPDVLGQPAEAVSADAAQIDKSNTEASQAMSEPNVVDIQPDNPPVESTGGPVDSEPEPNKGSGEADIIMSESKDVNGVADGIPSSVDAESAKVVPDETLPSTDHESDAKAPVESAKKVIPTIEAAAEPQIEPEAPPSPTTSKKSSSKRHSRHTDRTTKRSSLHEKSSRTNDATKSSSKRSSRYITEEPRVLHTRNPVRVSMTTAELEEQAERSRRRAARKAAETARVLEEEQRRAFEDEQKQVREAEERRVRREARRAEKAAAESAIRKAREDSEAAALKEAESRRRRRRDSVREHDVRPSTRDSKSGMFSLPRSFTGESANKVPSFARTGTGGSRSSGSRDYRPRASSSKHSDDGPPKVTTPVAKSDADEKERAPTKSTREDTKESSEPHSHRKHRRRVDVEQARSNPKEGDHPKSSRGESGKHPSSRKEGERRVPRRSEKEEDKKKPGLLKRIFG